MNSTIEGSAPTTNPAICILGGGAVVTEFYLPALRLLGWEQQVHVVDPSPTLQDKYTHWPAVTFHNVTSESFLNSALVPGNFAFAIVALPNFLHKEAVSLALRRGLPVLCEKPLTLTEHSSLELADLARQTGKTLGVAMVRRFLPYVTAMQDALRGNMVGKPLSLEIQHGGAFAWSSDSGAFFQRESGGVLADMGVHYLDIATLLAGALHPVRYRDDACGGIEANADFELKTDSGMQVHIKLSRTHDLANHILLVGEHGSLRARIDRFDSCDWTSLSHPGLKAVLAPAKPFQYPGWKSDFISCFAEQFLQFQQAVANSMPPSVDAEQAAKTTALIEWAYAHRTDNKLGVAAFVAAGDNKRPGLSPTPVVVTGGTGFIGTHLIERLTELGHTDMRVPVRNFQTCADAARFPVNLVRASLLDGQQLRRTFAGARYVFHLAYGRDQSESASITIDGTRKVVEAAIAEGVECVVVLSTMYVFGHPRTAALVDESWPYEPAGGFYGKTKVKMEKWCLQRSKTSGKTRIVVLNPSCVYGPGGKTYSLLPLLLLKAGTFGWIEDGKGIANFTYITNLVDSIILAATVPAAHGQRFLINDGNTSWKEFLSPLLGDNALTCGSWTLPQLDAPRAAKRTTLKDLGRHLMNDYQLLEIINGNPLLGAIKRQLFKLVPRFRSQLMYTRFGAAPPVDAADEVVAASRVPARWLGDLFGPTETRFSAQKARDILGWQPLVGLSDGQKQALAWLKDSGFTK